MPLHARLDRAAVEGLARRFGIDDITVFSVMDGGRENANYCLETSSGKYVLTLCDQKSLTHATNLASLLAHLADHGIHTSRVVEPPDGGPMVILHDERPVMLKHHVDGDIAANLTGDLLVQLGEEMARLHEISVPSYLPKSFPYGRSYFTEVIDSNLDRAYIDWLSEKKSFLHEQIPQHLPMALIHGDIFFDYLIVQGERLMAIIDFEEACHYYRSFDLGMVIVGTCRDRQGISFQKARQFLRGYQNDMTLESVERESLKAFAVYAAVATSFWRFRQYHLLRPDPQLYDKHVEMQTLADAISEYPQSSFTELFG
jgi:homoserine kinase type II